MPRQKHELDPWSHPSLRELDLPDALYGFAIRAPAAPGRVSSISLAEQAAGCSLLHAGLLGAEPSIEIAGTRIPVLAWSEVHYVGEPVGLVLGPDPLLAENLALTASVNMELSSRKSRTDWHVFSSGQIAAMVRLQHPGSPSSQTDQQDTLSFASSIEMAPSEIPLLSEEVAASWDYDKLTIYCRTLWPGMVRKAVGAMTGADVRDILIKPLDMESSNDLAVWYTAILAAQAALAAREMKRPVRIIVPWKSQGRFLPVAHGVTGYMQTRWSRTTGRLVSVEARCAIPVGPFSLLSRQILETMLSPLRQLPADVACSVLACAIHTDTQPMGLLECPANGALHAVITSHALRAAGALGVLPETLIASLVQEKQERSTDPDTGMVHGLPSLLLNRLASRSDFRRSWAANELVLQRNPGYRETLTRGIGIACAQQPVYPIPLSDMAGLVSVNMTLQRDLVLHIESSAHYGSTRQRKALAILAAQILGIPIQNVVFLPPAEMGRGEAALLPSASIRSLAEIIRRAAQRMQKLRFRQGLPCTVRAFARLRYQEDAASMPSEVRPAWGAATVELAFNRNIGELEVRRADLHIYAGKILDPACAAAALRKMACRALADCIAAQGLDREISRSRLLSIITINFLEDEKSATPRSCGALPALLIPAAFAGAWRQASGETDLILPLRWQQLYSGVLEP